MLRGIYTAKAAGQLAAAGVDLGVVATIELEQLLRIEGTLGQVERGRRRRRHDDVVQLGGRHLTARGATRLVGTHGRRSSCAHSGSRGSAVRSATVPHRRNRLPVLEGHGRRPANGVGQGVPAHRAGQASRVVRHGHLPGQRVHAAPAFVRDRQVWRAVRSVHRATGISPTDDRRGSRRHVPRPVPAHRVARRARGARGTHGPLRRMVAAVELRRLPRRVLGGPRGCLARRRVDAGQDDRDGPRCRRGAGASLPDDDPRHPPGSQPIRAPAQRARAPHRRRHGLSRADGDAATGSC